jgi:regulator of replication initiation timing
MKVLCIVTFWIVILVKINGQIISANDPFEPPKTCTLTESELDDILKIIQSVIDEKPPANLKTKQQSSDPCEQVTELKENIQELLQLIKDLKDNSISSLQYEELKSAYEIRITQIQNDFDIIKRSNEALNFKINELQAKIQVLTNKINQLMKENEELRNENRELKINWCVSEIYNQNYEAALKIVDDLIDDQNTLNQIISRAYQREKIYNILKFLHILKTNQHLLKGSVEMYRIMKAPKNPYAPDLNDPYVLYFDRILTQKFLSCESQRSSPVCEIRQNVYQVLDSWAILLREGYWSQINYYTRGTYEAAESMVNFMETLISKAYSTYDLSKVENILNGIKSLPWTTHHFEGHKKLFSMMQARNQMLSPQSLLLAFKMRQSMETHQDFTAQQKSSYNSMKNEFPQSVRWLIWSEAVLLRNTDHSQFYLIFDSMNMLASSSGLLNRWVFETEDEGKSFFIRAHGKSETLYAADNFYNQNRRNIRLAPKNQFNSNKWTIVLNTANQIQIRNQKHGEYLFTSAYAISSTKKRVFTWGVKEQQISNGVWELSNY